MLSMWMPTMRRWPALTINTKTLSYAFHRCNSQLRERLTVNIAPACSFCCTRKSFNSAASFATASVLLQPHSCFSSTAISADVSKVAGRRPTIASWTHSTRAVRSITTVRGDGDRRVQADGRWGMRRLRHPKRLNRIEKEKIWYRNRIQKLCKRGSEEEALELFEEMKENRIYPEVVVFNNLIAVLGRKGKIKEAFKLFNDLKKRALLPTEHTYTSLFNGCAGAGKRSHFFIQKIREEMDRRDVIPNTLTCNAMIKAYAMCGRADDAFEVYTSMQNWNNQPDLHTFSFLLMAACEDGEEGLERGLQVWQEMSACGLQPDLYSYNLMLRCYRDGGIPQGLLQPINTDDVIDSDQDGHPECDSEGAVGYVPLHMTKLYNMRLYLTAKGERWLEEGDVQLFMQAMTKSKVTPSIKTFHLLLSLLRNLPLSRDHFFWRVLKENGVDPDLPLMNALVELQAESGENLNVARAIIRFMTDIGITPTVDTYKRLALGCKRSSDGLELLKEMKSTDVEVNEEIFAVLLGVAFKIRNYSFLIYLMKEMKRVAILPDQKIKGILSHAAEPNDQDSMSSAMKKRLHGYRGYLGIWKRAMWVNEEDDNNPGDEEEEDPEEIETN